MRPDDRGVITSYSIHYTKLYDMCINDPVYTLNAVSSGGTWSGPGVSANVFNPEDIYSAAFKSADVAIEFTVPSQALSNS